MKQIPEAITRIQEMLNDSYSSVRYQHLRKLQRELLGFSDEEPETTKGFSDGGGTGTFQWFPPLIQEKAQYQRPNRTLNNLRILVSQTRAVEIVPKWTNLLDDNIEVARDAWWVQRSQGLDGYGGWKDDLDRAAMDFAGLGVGFLRVCVNEDEAGAVVGLKWRNPLHIGFDPFVTDPNDSDWFWEADLWGIEDAKERFPDFDWESVGSQYLTMDDVALDGVIIIEYFNRSPRKGEPGYIAMVEDFNGEIVEYGDAPFKEMNPQHAIQNFIPPGAKYPVGLVQMQSYASKRIEEIDEEIKTYAIRGTQVVVDHELLNAEDWKKLQKGEHPRYIAFGEAWNETARAQGRTPFVVMPRDQVPADLWQERMIWEQYLRESSGVSSSMAGIVNPENRTATEVNQVAQQTAAQTAFLSREFSRAMQSIAPKVGRVAKDYDNAEFFVTIGPYSVKFNDEGDEQTTSKVVWDGALTALIGEEDLIKTDVNMKRQLEANKHLQTFQINRNPETWKEYLKAVGYKNPSEHMIIAPEPPPNALGAENSPMMPAMG